MAVAAADFGVAPQQVTLARIRFLTVVRGGLRETPIEQDVEETTFSEFEARHGVGAEDVFPDPADYLREAERRIVYQPLREFLETLPTSQRELVHFIYWLGLSQAEVARRRGWHPMKVNRELQAIFARARSVLAPHKFALLAA